MTTDGLVGIAVISTMKESPLLGRPYTSNAKSMITQILNINIQEEMTKANQNY